MSRLRIVLRFQIVFSCNNVDGCTGNCAGIVWVTATGGQLVKNLERSNVTGCQLYWWDEVPAVLQFNPYIKSGYRAGT